MQRVILLFATSVMLLLNPVLKLHAQDEKVQFTAEWKKNTDKSILVITVTKGTAPFTFFVYDGSPFKNGKQISKTENITNKSFEVEIDKKMKVYICLYKDESNFASMWLATAEQ